MIRTVIAVALGVVIFGVSLPVIETSVASRSDQRLGTIAETFESKATSLVEEKEVPPPGEDGPRRVLEVDFPKESFLSRGVEVFVIERVPGEDYSIGRYRAKGSAGGSFLIEAPIENPEGNLVDLGQPTGHQRYSLVLQRQEDDPDTPLVVFRRAVDD